jgi:hypothetical protein
MRHETPGQPLPSRPGSAKRQRGRKRAAPRTAGLHIHPYTLAVGLGKQIRFSAPMEEVAAELELALRKCPAQEHAESPPLASKA